MHISTATQRMHIRSSLSLLLTFRDCNGEAIPVPVHDFSLKFYTAVGASVTAGRRDGQLFGCHVEADGLVLHVAAQHHNLSPGPLRCDITAHIPDDCFPGGSRTVADSVVLPVTLTASDAGCSTLASATIPLPMAVDAKTRAELTALQSEVRSGMYLLDTQNRFVEMLESGEISFEEGCRLLDPALLPEVGKELSVEPLIESCADPNEEWISVLCLKWLKAGESSYLYFCRFDISEEGPEPDFTDASEIVDPATVPDLRYFAYSEAGRVIAKGTGSTLVDGCIADSVDGNTFVAFSFTLRSDNYCIPQLLDHPRLQTASQAIDGIKRQLATDNAPLILDFAISGTGYRQRGISVEMPENWSQIVVVANDSGWLTLRGNNGQLGQARFTANSINTLSRSSFESTYGVNRIELILGSYGSQVLHSNPLVMVLEDNPGEWLYTALLRLYNLTMARCTGIQSAVTACNDSLTSISTRLAALEAAANPTAQTADVEAEQPSAADTTKAEQPRDMEQ